MLSINAFIACITKRPVSPTRSCGVAEAGIPSPVESIVTQRCDGKRCKCYVLQPIYKPNSWAMDCIDVRTRGTCSAHKSTPNSSAPWTTSSLCTPAAKDRSLNFFLWLGHRRRLAFWRVGREQPRRSSRLSHRKQRGHDRLFLNV